MIEEELVICGIYKLFSLVVIHHFRQNIGNKHGNVYFELVHDRQMRKKDIEIVIRVSLKLKK